MSERIIQFGDEGRLQGMLSDQARIEGLPVLLFNAGVIHRIGAHRLNVKLARALNSIHRMTFRFDLSGLGESAPAPPGDGYEAQSIADISAAVDVLTTESGAASVVCIGMCSGADNSYQAALADPRISHLILLDPYAYANEGAARADMIARVTSPDRWARKLGGMFSGGARNRDDTEDAAQDEERYEQGRPVPDLEEFGGDLKRLTDRGVKILIVYTGLVRALIMKPDHFFQTFDQFDFGGNIDVQTIPYTDHTFTQISAQKELSDHIVTWLGGS